MHSLRTRSGKWEARSPCSSDASNFGGWSSRSMVLPSTPLGADTGNTE